MLRLYDYWESGNCYKVRLLLSLLGIPYERIHIDIMQGESRTPGFLEKNPNGRVPLLEWPDGRRLAESNAILWYLAEKTRFLPDDPWQRANILQWMCFEQYSHEPNIAVARFWHFAKLAEKNRDALPAKMKNGYKALQVMDDHLESQPYFGADCYTIGDIALYAYTHVAHEGGFDLSGFPAIGNWLKRVSSEAGHVCITDGMGI